MFSDFIALELVDGKVRVLLDLGSGTVFLTVPTRLDDGNWHRVDILWNSDVSITSFIFSHNMCIKTTVTVTCIKSNPVLANKLY